VYVVAITFFFLHSINASHRLHPDSYSKGVPRSFFSFSIIIILFPANFFAKKDFCCGKERQVLVNRDSISSLVKPRN